MSKWICLQDCVWGPPTEIGEKPLVRQWRAGDTYTGDQPFYKNKDGDSVPHPYFSLVVGGTKLIEKE